MPVKTTKKPTRGGARSGAGRKPSGRPAKVVVSGSVSPQQRKRLEAWAAAQTPPLSLSAAVAHAVARMLDA